ncbi:MAG TPA: hypothetical protein VN767_05400, partial [Streptosporangiaceae bacterium]|nr:hypothetical protein [Streptosporangiaceae bacterium]
MLVPNARFQAFSESIDHLQLRGRITFAAAEADRPLKFPLAGADEPEQRGRLAGKLQFADHPYTGWIQRRMIAPGRNALCVETAAGLDGEGFRVTLAGQTRNGTEGSHGRNSSEYVIGFSNASLIEEFEAEIGSLEQALVLVDAALEALTRRASEDAEVNDAYVALSAYTWSQVDVTGAATVMKELMAKRDRIKNASKRLAELDQLIGKLGQQHEDAIGERRLLKDELDKLEKRHVSLVDEQDSISDELHRLEDEHSVALTEVQSERLDAEFKKAVAPGDPENLADFGANLGRLNVRLRQALQQSEDEVARGESELVKVFIQFKNMWQDEFPNLGTALESYLDYQRILDEIDAGGLAESQAAWQQALTQWSGEDLVPLATSIRNAVSDIFDRLAPVNAILA